MTDGVLSAPRFAAPRRLGPGAFDAAPGNTAMLRTLVDAKGDLLVGTAADTVARLAVGSDGTVLIADSTQTAGVRWGDTVVRKIKTADEGVANTTAQNDDHLVATIAANETWLFKMALFCTNSAAGSLNDIKLGFTFPAGATLIWGSHGADATTLTPNGTTSRQDWTTSTTTLSYGIYGTGNYLIIVEGCLQNAGTAGSLQLQWALQTATGTTTTIKQGSWLELTKVS